MSEVVDQIEQMDAPETVTDVSKCPSCGANMTWSPEERKLMCEHCGTKVDIDLNKFGEEIDFAQILKDNNTWGKETRVFRCNNCGAKVVVSSEEISKACPFCGTSNVVEIDELSGLKPNAVIPFEISKDKACENVTKWAKKKIFAPNAFKKTVYPDKISGNYTPAFTFDTNTMSQYNGVLGQYYYVTVQRNGKSYTERRTRYIPISGDFGMDFDDILVQAGSTINQKTVDKLQPFDTNNCKSYANEFLHGFSASQYSRDGEQCWNEARKLIDSRVKSAVLAQYSYDFIQSINIYTMCQNITYKYLLLPVYVGHCNWKTKLYNFFVNGKNGKVTGKTPVSALKVFIATAIGLVVVAGVAVALYFGLR